MEVQERSPRGCDSSAALPQLAYLLVAHANTVFVDELSHFRLPILAVFHCFYRDRWVEVTTLIKMHEPRDRTRRVDALVDRDIVLCEYHRDAGNRVSGGYRMHMVPGR